MPSVRAGPCRHGSVTVRGSIVKRYAAHFGFTLVAIWIVTVVMMVNTLHHATHH